MPDALHTVRVDGGYSRWATYEVDFDGSDAVAVRRLVITDKPHWRTIWRAGGKHSFAAHCTIKAARRQAAHA